MSSNSSPRCIVLGCDGFFMTTQPGPYYLLQGRDRELLVDWLKACKYSELDIERTLLNVSSNDVICASHFIGRKFRSDVANQRIPSVFPWSQCCTSEENSRHDEMMDAVIAESDSGRIVTDISGHTVLLDCEPPSLAKSVRLSASARRLSDLISRKRAVLFENFESTPESKKSKAHSETAVDTPATSTQKPTVANRCIVPGCDGFFRGENNAVAFKPKYFTLPVKDDRLLQEWLMAIGMSAKSDLSAGKICCTHFKDGLFSASDPLHRMPIVFAPRQAEPVKTPSEQPKTGSKSGLKPNFRPSFAKKPVPISTSGENGTQQTARVAASGSAIQQALGNRPAATSAKFGRPDSQMDESDDDSDNSSSQSDSSSDTSDSDESSDSSSNSSSSLEFVSAMPKLHSAAMTSGLGGSKLTLLSPEGLCSMIYDNHQNMLVSSASSSQIADNESWRGFVDCDMPQNKSFGFGKFLFTLGLNIVRHRVYKSALSASERQEKRDATKPILSANTKSAVTKAVEHMEGELGLKSLDKFISKSKIGKQQCSRCSFVAESRLILEWHHRQPHFDRTKRGHVFCCLCKPGEPSMRMATYREHLRYGHGCSFVAFDLFTQPYQCHYCTVSCSTWQVLLSHMNNCRLTFNVFENLCPDPKTDITLAVNLAKPPDHMVIDRHYHAENPIYQALNKQANAVGLRSPQSQENASPIESTNFVDISDSYGLAPISDVRNLAAIGFDSPNQDFASFFGFLRPPALPATRTTVIHVPQSTAIVQIVQSQTAPSPAIPVAPQRSSIPIATSKPLQASSQRFSFAPPSELPSSFRPIRVAKLPEITMATIAAATAASRPTPYLINPSTGVKPNILDTLPAPPVRDAPLNSIIKRPQPPFTGANTAPPTMKRFRQTEFTLTTMQRLLFCELCRGIVQEREALRIHLFWAHRIGLPPSSMMTDEWYTASCPSCGVGFYTPDGIEQHNIVGCYTDVFVPTFCVVCHKFLSTSSLLCAHLAKEHGLTPPSMTRARVCFICSSAFDTEDHCADHLRLGHQVTTEQNSEREDFINVIWQGQLVASVDPDAIGTEAAAAMLSLQAAAAFAGDDDDSVMIEQIDSHSGPAGGLGNVGGYGGDLQQSGVSSANRMLFLAARGSVAAPFRRGPGRPPLRGPGRPRGSRARGPYRPRGTRGPYRPRGSRLHGMRSARGPGRPPLSSSGPKRAAPKRRAPRDASAAGKARWFHEEFSLTETDESEFDPNEVDIEPDEPEVELDYDEDYDGYYDGGFDPRSRQQSAKRSMHKYA